MPLKRFHVIVVEDGPPHVFSTGAANDPGAKIEFSPVAPLLDVRVEVQDTFRDKDGVDVPLALQLQLRHALEAARPNEY